MGKKKVRLLALALIAGLTAALTLVQPASAAVRSWSPYQSLSGWPCTVKQAGFSVQIKSCLVYGVSDGQMTYRAVLSVFNNSRDDAVRLRGAVINLYAGPSTAVKVRDDGCLDSSLSPGYGALCWGTIATHSQVCAAKPSARWATANGAITINTGLRASVISPQHPIVSC